MIVLASILIGLLLSGMAAGIDKPWEISPGESSSNEEIVNPVWPRLDLSAFEVRSISGIGHLAARDYFPPIKQNAQLQLNREDIVISNESAKNRIAKEADDMVNTFTPEILYDHHPIFTGIAKNSRKDVEMLPGSWEKTRQRGRTGRNQGFCSGNSEDVDDSGTIVKTDEPPRVRRDAQEPEMEKISSTNNVREPRLNSPESWSKQPLSIEFRHRANADQVVNVDSESLRSSLRRNQEPPLVDFVTGNRRSFTEARESRDLPISRSFSEDSYKNNIRHRDIDMSYPVNYYYPENVRSDRQYFIRRVNEPRAITPERYRIDDFDLYRNRPTPKPKRIIYYATLPEVVRKPVDLRTYSRPYDTMGRVSVPSINRDGIYKRLSNIMDSRYRYKNYPYASNYDDYDGYFKKLNYQERPFTPYNDRLHEDRYREQDLDHASFKDAATSDEATIPSLNIDVARREQDKLPWPVHIGTEINVKDNQRVTGRKIFGQQ